MAQLVCFTNCYLPQEDGNLVRKDLWIDAQSGHILDAQVRHTFRLSKRSAPSCDTRQLSKENILCCQAETYYHHRLGRKHSQVNLALSHHPARSNLIPYCDASPGFLDIQINGAYGFDFSIYEDDQHYNDGLRMVASRIVETGVTRCILP